MDRGIAIRRAELLEQVPMLHSKRALVPADLESVLRRTSPEPIFRNGDWDAVTRARGLFVDLSKIEWVDLSATVRLALIIDRALRDGLPVSVAMPLETARSTEQTYGAEGSGLPAQKRQELNARKERRRAARRFLDRLKFLQAIQAPHLEEAPGELRIVEGYDSSLDLDKAGVKRETEEQEVRTGRLEEVEPYIVPLSWLTPESQGEVVRHFVSVVDNRHRGFGSRFDAEALSDVVLHELVDNAVRHSGGGRALVAAFAQPSSLVPRPEDYPLPEQGFAGWLAEMKRPHVEVVVGDSGVGVQTKLGSAYDAARSEGRDLPQLPRGRNASVLAWAFDRLSTSLTSPRSGTRGLYRVDRIVKRHLGLLTIRSGEELVGWDHGGLAYDAVVSAGKSEKRITYAPGTVVRAQMVAVPERPPIRSGGEKPSDLAFEFGMLRMGANGEAMIDGKPVQAVLGKAKGTCWILAPDPEFDLRDDREMERLFAAVCGARDPETVAIIGLPHFEKVERSAEAVNMAIEKSAGHREDAEATRYEVSDPILLIGRQPGELAWTGTTTATANLLKELLQAPGAEATPAALREMVPDPDMRAEITMRLRRDDGLATLSEEGVQLRLHLRAIADAVAARFEARVEKDLRSAASDEVWITPSLASVTGWIDVDKAISSPQDLTLACHALAHRARVEAGLNKADRAPSLILADSAVDDRRLEALRAVLGIGRHETIPSDSGLDGFAGAEVAETGERVVVYADLIASGESVRGCLSQIMRDGATPVAVLCLVDVRERPGEPIELWGLGIPVVTLVRRSTWTKREEGKQLLFVDSQGNFELPHPPPPEYPLQPERLLDLATESEAIHVGHIGGNTGRHFTFYVNAQHLLDGPELKDALRERVARWKSEGGSADSQVQVWYPRPEPKVTRPGEYLAGIVAASDDRFRKRGIARQRVWGGWKFPLRGPDIREGEDVLIVDWGALEGASLMEMVRLAAEGGARRVLACVCLSQLPIEAEWHLRTLRELEVEQRQPAEDLLAPPSTRTVRVPVEVEFLSAIPVRSFGIRDCPVCQQLNRLGEHEMPTDEMKEFARDQRERRLHLTSRAKAAEQEVQRLDGSPLGGRRSVAMLKIRHRLEEGLRSTRLRYDLSQELSELKAKLDDSAGPEEIERATDWMRLLALEPQWLGRPPLVLEETRRQVAAIAAWIALLPGIPDDDRTTAIATLRASSKQALAEHAPQIFRIAHEEPSARGQLLYGLLTYLDRPYLQTPDVLRSLVETLQAMRSAIWQGDIPESDGEHEVKILLERAILRQGTAELADEPPEKAWQQLKELLDFVTKAHQDGTRIRRLEADIDREHPSDLSPERQDQLQKGVLADWEWTEHFFRDQVLPRLSRLRRTLDGPTAKNFFGPNLGWLTALVDQHASVAEWPISKIAARVHEGGARFNEDAVWVRFVTEFKLIADMLLRQPQPPRESGAPVAPGPARLIRFLDSVPGSLPKAIEYACSNYRSDLIGKIEIVGVPDHLDLYFPDGELKELLYEILANVDKHHVSRSANGPVDAPPAQVRIELIEEPETATLVVTNTSTERSEKRGIFLARLRRSLACFEGNLDSRSLSGPEPYTFRVTATFRRYNRDA